MTLDTFVHTKDPCVLYLYQHLGLATGLPARIVSSAFTEWPSTQSVWKIPLKLSVCLTHTVVGDLYLFKCILTLCLSIKSTINPVSR